LGVHVHLFKGGALRVAAPAAQAKNSVSFWELFLCACFVKEKVDKGQKVVIICGTIFRYQDFLAAFLCLCRPKEKLTKEKAVMQGYSPRTLGRFLKKAPQKLI